MVEANPTTENKGPDIGRMIREIELEIDELAAGLTRVRSSIARLSMSAMPLITRQHEAEMYARQVAERQSAAVAGGDTASPGASEAVEAESGAVEDAAPQDTFSDVAEVVTEEDEPASGFANWGSIADGASWPRLKPVERDAAPGFSPEQPLATDEWDTSTSAQVSDAVAIETIDETNDTRGPDLNAWGIPSPHDGAVEAASDVRETAESQPESTLTGEWEWNPSSEVAESDPDTDQIEVVAGEATDLGDGGVKPPSSSWMGESGWSQGFNWPSQPVSQRLSTDEANSPAERDTQAFVDDADPQSKAGASEAQGDSWGQPRLDGARGGGPEPSHSEADDIFGHFKVEADAPDHRGFDGSWATASLDGGRSESAQAPADPQATVADIVAQMRAEIEAGSHTGERHSGLDWNEMPNGEPEDEVKLLDESPEEDMTLPVGALESSTQEDDAAKREDVSRAVAEMRRQIEAGGLEAVMREQGLGFGPTQPESSEPSSEDAGDVTADEVQPAFRLAAPGSVPDWSHTPMQPSGPPVVLIKDSNGRVELARVYETLSSMGCGDGAALLNYTPHSVTIGLPASAPVPSNDRIAEAVAGIFGTVSRVESDGVRITVTLGADSRRGNAA